MIGASLVLTGVLVVAAACVPGASDAQERVLTSEVEEIGIDAEEITYDQKADTVIARGDVVITRGDVQLRADEVRVNRTTNEAEARGHVSLKSPNGMLVAEVAYVNLDEETGFLEHAHVESQPPQYSLSGRRVEKGRGHSYHIEDGQFTTCHCADGPPSWSLSAEDLRVSVGGYGTLRGGKFNVLDVPLLYLPRAFFPVQRERQSGFLMPEFGASNRRGFQALLPFYWAINRSHDATVAFDVETSARAGVLAEYRYALGANARASLEASYFSESLRGLQAGQAFESTVPRNRWSVIGEGAQPVVELSQLYADVFLVGDDLFLRDINTYAFEHSRGVAIRTLPFTESRAGILHARDRVVVKGEGTYYQDLQATESRTLQRAPELSVWGQRRVFGSLLGQLNATAVDFQRGQGVDGVRLDIEPTARVPVSFGRFGFGALHASMRETTYHLQNQTLAGGGGLSANHSRETVELGASVGTGLNRIYGFGRLGVEKIKHTIEPMLEYRWLPAVDQGDLPLFDGSDGINRRNLFTYGVVSRLIGKFTASGAVAPEVRELGRMSVSQSVDLTREIEPLQVGRAADHFSDADIDALVKPSRALSLRFRTNYDATNNQISAAHVGFFVEDPRQFTVPGQSSALETRTSAGVAYRVLIGNILQEVDTNVVLRLTDWAGVLYASRYDVVANDFLDNHFGLRLLSTCDCWALDIAVTDKSNPQEVEVRAQVTLVGLGSSRPSERRATALP